LLTLVILFTETCFMWFLQPRIKVGTGLGGLFDTLVLLTTSLPCLYVLFMVPLLRTLREKTAATQALVQALADLDRSGQDHTADLKESYDVMVKEAERRILADARVNLQTKILDVVQQGVVATDAKGGIIYWNRCAEWLFGWTEQEMLGQPVAPLAQWPEAPDQGGVMDQVAAQGWWSGEVQARQRDGGTFPALLTSAALWEDGRVLQGIVYTFMDISAMRLVEEELRHTQEKYTTVVENSPTGVFIYHQGRIVFGNSRFFQMVGRTQAEVEAMAAIDLIDPQDQSRFLEVIAQRLHGLQADRDDDYRVLTPKGVLWVSGRGALIRHQGQAMLLGNIQDTTERHHMEQALRDSKASLSRLSAQVLTAQEDERRRVAFELHDSLGQSLSAIKFMVERVLEVGCSDPSGAGLRTLSSVVPLIKTSVEEVRRISMALRPSTLDDLGLLATLDWLCREFQVAYPHLRVRKDWPLEETQIPEALKTSIFRVHQEAMNNAVKHGKAQEIRISLVRTEAHLQMDVVDDGVGFDPLLVRLEALDGGFGLGSMRERTEALGGAFAITTRPGEGTRVTARWPQLTP
jgi:PAS domain S-box-containing protein